MTPERRSRWRRRPEKPRWSSACSRRRTNSTPSIMPVGPTRRGGGVATVVCGAGVCLVGSMASVGVGASARASFAGVLFSGAPTQREVVGRMCCSPDAGSGSGSGLLRFEARVVLRAPGDVVVGPSSLTPGPTGMPSGVPAPWERIETVFLAGAARRPRLSRDANNDRGRVQRCERARGDERRARLMFEREAGRGSRGRKGERRRSVRRRVAQPLQSPRAGKMTMTRRTRPRTIFSARSTVAGNPGGKLPIFAITLRYA